MKRNAFLIMMMLTLPLIASAQKTLYAMVTYPESLSGLAKMTIYYDDQKYSREGRYTERWYKFADLTAYVVFDASMADYHPTSTSSWFKDFTVLYWVDGLEYLNTDQTTDMSYMFYGCKELEELDLSHFNTEKVTNMNHMFRECRNLVRLDLSGFTANSLTTTFQMFYLCEALTTIKCKNDWSKAPNIEYSTDMFGRCEELVGSRGTTYESDHIDISRARPDRGEQAPGYFSMDESDYTDEGKEFNYGLYRFRIEKNSEGNLGAVIIGFNTDNPEPFTESELNSAYLYFNSNSYRVFAIGEKAFANNVFTEPFDFTGSLFWNITDIRKEAFAGCKADDILINWQNVETIGEKAFMDTNVRYFATSSNTGPIGNSAFQDCKQLERVYWTGSFYDQDLRFGDYSFYGCTALQTVALPFSVKAIGAFAFSDITSLKRVSVEQSSPLDIPDNVFTGSNPNATLRVPPGSEDAYLNATGWNYFTNISSSDMGATFEDAVFSYEIGDVWGNTSAIITGLSSAFKGTVAKLPSKYVEYGGSTFPVEMVADNAFFGNETLTEIDLTAVDRQSDDDEYYWWRMDIGEMAFAECESLQRFKCESTTNIGRQAFAESGLRSVNLPNLEYSIGEQAFSKCKELTTVSIHSNYGLTLCDQAFASCPKLSSVKLNNMYGYMYDMVFYNDGALSSIVIPEGLSIYGKQSFWKCKNLRKVVSESTSPEDIDAQTFDGLPNDAQLLVPEGTVDLYKSKTGWNHFGDNVMVKPATATGMAEVIMANDSLETPPSHEGCYTLDGRSFTDQCAGSGNSGIVIRNGRKVIVK